MKLPTLPLLTRMRLLLPQGPLWPRIETPVLVIFLLLVLAFLPALLDAPRP